MTDEEKNEMPEEAMTETPEGEPEMENTPVSDEDENAESLADQFANAVAEGNEETSSEETPSEDASSEDQDLAEQFASAVAEGNEEEPSSDEMPSEELDEQEINSPPEEVSMENNEEAAPEMDDASKTPIDSQSEAVSFTPEDIIVRAVEFNPELSPEHIAYTHAQQLLGTDDVRMITSFDDTHVYMIAARHHEFPAENATTSLSAALPNMPDHPEDAINSAFMLSLNDAYLVIIKVGTDFETVKIPMDKVEAFIEGNQALNFVQVDNFEQRPWRSYDSNSFGDSAGEMPPHMHDEEAMADIEAATPDTDDTSPYPEQDVDHNDMSYEENDFQNPASVQNDGPFGQLDQHPKGLVIAGMIGVFFAVFGFALIIASSMIPDPHPPKTIQMQSFDTKKVNKQFADLSVFAQNRSALLYTLDDIHGVSLFARKFGGYIQAVKMKKGKFTWEFKMPDTVPTKPFNKFGKKVNVKKDKAGWVVIEVTN